jgi:hypothetical protein
MLKRRRLLAIDVLGNSSVPNGGLSISCYDVALESAAVFAVE